MNQVIEAADSAAASEADAWAPVTLPRGEAVNGLLFTAAAHCEQAPELSAPRKARQALARQLSVWVEESVVGKPNKPKVGFYEIRVLPTFV